MYISRLRIENFRIFGDKNSGTALDLPLSKGLNLIVGENDSGKTAILDAVRILLNTRDNERTRLSADDFHMVLCGNKRERAKDLRIECQFEDLSNDEAAAFLEWIGISDTDSPQHKPQYFLRVWLESNRRDKSELTSRFDREISVSIKAGSDTEGLALDSDVRELLRVTYLKPLRDAEQELAARKGSRLSQIFFSHPEIQGQGDTTNPNTLASITQKANQDISQHPAIKTPIEQLNSNYLSGFTLSGDSVSARVGVAESSLRGILESLELTLADLDPTKNTFVETTQHGLGLSNLLFMATEMLLIQSPRGVTLSAVLIEEPEAHLHPQLQIRLIDFIQSQAHSDSPIQFLMTTHSPNLASRVDIDQLVMMQSGKAFPMSEKYTRLSKSDYSFLRRFLDVTKADLFFARGVIIVEGDAEQLLLPAIAELMGVPLVQYGVSILNVGHVGLFRYSRIFERVGNPRMDIRVICLADADIPPREAKSYLRVHRDGTTQPTVDTLSQDQVDEKKRARESKSSGETVKTFVSDFWTFEYDLARCGLALYVHSAIQLALASNDSPDGLSDVTEQSIIERSSREYEDWQRNGKSIEEIAAMIYQPLYEKAASKTETAQFMAKLLVEKTWDTNEIRKRLPIYLRDAILWVTRQN